MVIRKADEETEAGAPPTEPLINQMLAYNQQMIDAGIMREGAGLQRTAKGARVSFKNGTPTITDGPFAEAKELIAGYSIIEVQSKEEALEWLKKWPPLDGHGNVQLELRQLFMPEDFGDLASEQAKTFESNKSR